MKKVIFFLISSLTFHALFSQTTWQDYTKNADSLQLNFQFKDVIEPRQKAIDIAKTQQKDTVPFLNLLLEMSKNELATSNAELKSEAYKSLQSQILELEESGAEPERLYQAYRRMYIFAHNYMRNMRDTDKYVAKSIDYHYKCQEIDSVVLMKTLHTSGVVSRVVGRLNASVAVLKKAEDLYQHIDPEVRNTNNMASIYLDLAMVYNYEFLNIPSKRLKYLKKSEATFKSVDKPNMDYFIGVYTNLSDYEELEGNYKKAENYLKKAIQLYKDNAALAQESRRGKIGFKRDLQFKASLLKIYRETGQEDNMLSLFQEMKTINSENTLDDIETDFIATAYLIVARYYRFKNNEKALTYLNEGLEFHKKINFKKLEDQFTIEKIKILIDEERYVEAEKLLKEIEGEEKLRPTIENDILVLHASLNFKKKNNEAYTYINKLIHGFSEENKALDIKTMAYQDFTPSLVLNDIQYLLELIENLEKSSFKDDTVRHTLYLIALKQFESNFHHEFLNEKLKKTYDKISFYFLEKASNNQLAESDIDLFLNFTETIEAKYLLNTFIANRAESNLNETDELIHDEQRLRSNITYLKKKNIEKKSDSLRELIFEENLKLDAIKDQIKEQGFYISQIINSEDSQKQKQIFKDRYIIKYKIVNNQVFRIIYNNNNIKFTNLGSYLDIKPEVTKMLSKTKNINVPIIEIKKHGANLHSILLTDVDLASNNNIYIIPDGILHYLPFELLVSNNDYLLNQTKISYVSALSFIDSPVEINKENDKIALFAPSYNLFAPTDTQLAVRGEPYYLDGAIKEVNSISELFENSDVYTNNNASKEAFKSLSNDYSILHLSMHSFLNDADSELSSLVFSDTKADYELYISELYGLNLNANMVVLSACNTGVGEFKTGKGIVSMNTAFTAAGVPSVLSSLWSAPDDATKEIMVSFYKHLKDGNDKAEALQKAKQDFLSANENMSLDHPYYWAGFVMSGDISPIVDKKNNTIWYVIGGGALILLVVLFYRKQKKQAA
ncbi:CHAT domain-containing protein [Bizionia sp.]|uniref:CHAT domain-containing protein n=1 Tax=Bizionia sp. TaxID=1954480 RepID=UPI003A93B28A